MASITKVDIFFLLDRYDALAFDAFGVLLNESGLMPGAGALLKHLNDIRKPYWIVTNGSSRTLEGAVAFYQGMGLPLNGEKIITSGCLLGDYFAKEGLAGRRVAVLGTEASRSLAVAAGGIPVDILRGEECEVIVVSNQTEFPFVETLDAVISLTIQAREQGRSMRLVLTNPDLIYPKGSGRYGITSGAIALVIEHALELRFPGDPANRFCRLGKPYAPIFTELVARSGTRNIVMIGDQLETDIKGARNFGLDAVLYTRGITNPSIVDFAVEEASCPTYLLDDLWPKRGGIDA